MSDGLLRIGPFSRASSLSVKALRFYHERGLLVPSLVDPVTGYRAYAVAQLLDAAVLARLRDLDVPLDRIADVLRARDPEVTERVLADHARRMRDRLAETTRIVAELQRGIDHPSGHTPVHVRQVPHRHALGIDARMAPESFAELLGMTFARLEDVAAALDITSPAPLGALYRAELADEQEEVTCVLVLPDDNVPSPPTGTRIVEVPAAAVAVVTHLGSYDTIGDTYRHLGAWVAEHEATAELDVREWYLVSPPADVAELRTEIHWPVVSAM